VKPIELVKRYASNRDADLYCYMGYVFYENASEFVDLICAKTPKRKNCVLFLSTLGGDADAAYRIMRALRGSYGTVTLAVNGLCKSAGTLMAIGANNVLMSKSAEFGPLDIQVRKPDEVYASGSGLDIFQAIAATTANAFDAFEKWTIKLAEDTAGAISTKTAAELASQMAVGLFQPIMAQIDPHRLGEIQRAIRIVQKYGARLDRDALYPDAMSRLVGDYPSHGFVIDLQEAKTLFKRVDEMDKEALEIAKLLGSQLRHYGNKIVSYSDLESRFAEKGGATNETRAENGGSKPNIPARARSGDGNRKTRKQAGPGFHPKRIGKAGPAVARRTSKNGA